MSIFARAGKPVTIFFLVALTVGILLVAFDIYDGQSWDAQSVKVTGTVTAKDDFLSSGRSGARYWVQCTYQTPTGIRTIDRLDVDDTTWNSLTVGGPINLEYDRSNPADVRLAGVRNSRTVGLGILALAVGSFVLLGTAAGKSRASRQYPQSTPTYSP
jgi:hypothetical protein